jgi:hypothetical protein
MAGIDERAESKPVVQSACNKITFDTLALELEHYGLENASIYKSNLLKRSRLS